jgi:hypothetical protein
MTGRRRARGCMTSANGVAARGPRSPYSTQLSVRGSVAASYGRPLSSSLRTVQPIHRLPLLASTHARRSASRTSSVLGDQVSMLRRPHAHCRAPHLRNSLLSSANRSSGAAAFAVAPTSRRAVDRTCVYSPPPLPARRTPRREAFSSMPHSGAAVPSTVTEIPPPAERTSLEETMLGGRVQSSRHEPTATLPRAPGCTYHRLGIPATHRISHT